MINKKETVSFRKIILAGTPSDVLAHKVQGDGTVEEVRIRFYSGHQKTLHIRPFIEHKGAKIEDLISYPATTENYLSGDNEGLVFPVVFSVEQNDYIKVWVENVDTLYDRTLVVDIVIDYYAGRNRIIGGVVNG